MHSGGAVPILGPMTTEQNPPVDLGFVELDPAGFEVIPRRPRPLLRHSCGHTDFLDDYSFPGISSAAFLHRMDGCKAGNRTQCGLCRRDFEPGERFRHDGHTWVHNDGCPQYTGVLAIPLPSPTPNTAEGKAS